MGQPFLRVEVSALHHRGSALRGATPLLRLQGDERLVALTRRGNQAAYETLVGRYQARLLAFCRHMLRSREDAEDVLQEVFAAAFNALHNDERSINVRPWLYRIARNRCLNHLRRTQPIGVDSMDIHFADNGASTADRVHDREEFRLLIADVQELAETQRTALLLREIDAMSYDQIAEAMETTVSAVKSLLVRARVGLAESTEARRLSCDEVREELGEVAEGLKRRSAPVRRHTRDCDRCSAFEKDLRQTNKALAAVFPVGPLLLLKNFLVAHGASQAAAGSATAGVGAGAAAAGASSGAGSAITAGLGVLATKAGAGLAAAALVTAGAVEVDHVRSAPVTQHHSVTTHRVVPVVAPAPRVVATTPQPTGRVVNTLADRHATAAVAKHVAAKPSEVVAVPAKATITDAVPVVTAIVAPAEAGSAAAAPAVGTGTAAPTGGVMAPSDTAPPAPSGGPAPTSGQQAPAPATTTPPADTAPSPTTPGPGITINLPAILPRG